VARSDNAFLYEGTPEGDVINANNRANLVYGFAGNDTIFLLDGDDTALSHDGDDTIWGGNGNDVLKGMAGKDLLYGETGNDELWGQKGEDTLQGGDGADILWGGADKDFQHGGSGADTFEYRTYWESTTRPFNDTNDGTPIGQPNPEYSDVTGGFADVDEIFGFESGIDKLLLIKLDADVSTPVVTSRKGSTGNDDFRYVSKTDGFVAGDLTVTYTYDAAGAVTGTTVDAHIDNDGIPDLTIFVHGYVNPATDIWF
jgi:hypothetical protein